MIPAWLLQWLSPILSALAVYLVVWGRQDRKDKDRERDARIHSLERGHAELTLQLARDIPSKEDFSQIGSRLDRLDDMLGKIRDMVIRLEERSQINDRE